MEPLKGSFFLRQVVLEYTALESIPYFSECSAEMAALGYTLVELKVVPRSGAFHVSAVIASGDPGRDICVSDCSRAHHALLPKIAVLLGRSEEDIYMEVGSPGIERNIKNAAEFAVFTGRLVRVWDRNEGDWVSGRIVSSDTKSVVLDVEGEGSRTESYDDIAKAKFLH